MSRARKKAYVTDHCSDHYGRVIDAREYAEGLKYRRRQCDTCGKRWSTYEVSKEEYDFLCLAKKLINDAQR